MESEPTLRDVLSVMETRFDGLETRFDRLDADVAHLGGECDRRFTSLEGDVGGLKRDVAVIRATTTNLENRMNKLSPSGGLSG